ncbi:hypothetical protein GQ53DRAFT_202917 [Thozetella sp. PMI_491]|nr:hypothetical protein GQ53DRAFT_202917 [Thozetella sp. PMI_491]
MTSFSPLPTYAVGGLSLGLALHGLIFPRAEYRRFGLPLERPKGAPVKGQEPEGIVSPLIQLKGLRELAFGLSLIALQYQGNDAAVTTVLAVISTSGLGDGIIVWAYGGDEFRSKVFGHWGAFVVLLGWACWRAQAQ